MISELLARMLSSGNREVSLYLKNGVRLSGKALAAEESWVVIKNNKQPIQFVSLGAVASISPDLSNEEVSELGDALVDLSVVNK